MPRHPTMVAWVGLAMFLIFALVYAINLVRF